MSFRGLILTFFSSGNHWPCCGRHCTGWSIGGTIGLRYRSARGGEVTLPVMYATSGKVVVVLVGRSTSQKWWRHVFTRRPVDVWWHRAWRPTTAQAFTAEAPEHSAAAEAYRLIHPHIKTSCDPVVLVTIPMIPVRSPSWAVIR